MSVSNALQTLIYQRLMAYPALVALIGGRVYDGPRATALAPYVTFGASDYVEDDVDCIIGRVETIQIDVWSIADDGKRECKSITDAVKNALHLYAAEPTEGALVQMRVVLVRVMDDPDMITKHGVVQVEMMVEE